MKCLNKKTLAIKRTQYAEHIEQLENMECKGEKKKNVNTNTEQRENR